MIPIVNAREEQYQEIELFGKPALFTNSRIDRDSVSENLHCYDLRGSDNDPGRPTTIEPHVVVNHAGSVLTHEPVIFRKNQTAHRLREGLNFLGGIVSLADFCKEHGIDYLPDNRKYSLRPASPDEAGLFYSQEDNDKQLATVGHMRFDHGHGGNEFWSTWWSHNGDELNIPEFNREFQEFVDELRKKGPLKNLSTMSSYCYSHKGELDGGSGGSYCYIAESDNYRYCLRCTPRSGDYSYIYVYDKRQQELLQKSEDMVELIAQMQYGVCDSPEITTRVLELAEQLKSESGKMQYGYLKPRLKSMVNEIVDELERIPAIRECYEKWQELQGAVQNYYTGEPPERLPLSQRKEFKAIKNAVIREALNITNGVITFEDDALGVVEGNDPQYIEVKQCMAEAYAEPEKLPLVINHLKKYSARDNQFAQYQLGKLYLAGEDTEQDTDKAVQYFTASAEQGNQYAQYALGKLYLLGKDVPRDKEAALHWLELSAAQGNIYAQFFIDHANNHGNPSALLLATRLIHHMGNIFRGNSALPGNSRGIFIDSKRRRKLREMKIAAGHAEDEQDSEYTQILSY